MPDNFISRSNSTALMPVPLAKEIFQAVSEKSAAMQLFTQVPLSTYQTRVPVLSALPSAGFVNGDTGVKPTTTSAWINRTLSVEEIASIVVIPEAVLDDSAFDIVAAVKPKLVEALGRTLDAAIFFGVNKPSSWPTDIVSSAVAAGNYVARGTHTATNGGIAEDINSLMATVENEGFDVNGFVAARGFRQYLRGARDAFGQRLLDINGNTEQVEGQPIVYGMSGLWPSGYNVAQLITGDFTQGIIGIRQDVTMKLLTEASLTLSDSTVINLAQQDSVALRVVFRVAFQVANPVNYTQPTEADRYPFAVLRTPAAVPGSSASSSSGS